MIDRPDDSVAADSVAADAPTALVRPDDLVAALATWLRNLHGGPVDALSTVATADAIAAASARVDNGAVGADGLEAAYRSVGPDGLLRMAADLAGGIGDESSVPVAADVTTGVLRLADVRLRNGKVVVPTGAAVAGDPYADLAALALDLAAAIGPGAVPALFDAYGLDRPEPARIELWVALTQLLR